MSKNTAFMGEPGVYPRGLREQGGVHPGQGANSLEDTITPTFAHPFGNANQSTAHVFGLGEETGVPRGNPRSTGNMLTRHTQGRGGNEIHNPRG
ncbi:hypothetical protein AMELA_G00023420 [Ameiurus melas]|uniref:Uncharacterized protein n=1 Tax=Ameiurus melas TaxID=219545 RepID=A0A7J6BCL0_AMEME|nr:hypothetical protein AMELA_G00023420 [Ameiurus melas]